MSSVDYLELRTTYLAKTLLEFESAVFLLCSRPEGCGFDPCSGLELSSRPGSAIFLKPELIYD